MRITPRFGKSFKNLNDVIINFDFKGQMICELQIKLGTGTEPLHFESHNFVHEIERACDSKDLRQLYDAYTGALLRPPLKDRVIDTSLKSSKRGAADGD